MCVRSTRSGLAGEHEVGVERVVVLIDSRDRAFVVDGGDRCAEGPRNIERREHAIGRAQKATSSSPALRGGEGVCVDRLT